MREIPYTSKLAYAEDGRALALNYSILANSGKCEFEQYGVKIMEKNSGEQAMAFNLTVSGRRIYELMDKLTQGSVTPVWRMFWPIGFKRRQKDERRRAVEKPWHCRKSERISLRRPHDRAGGEGPQPRYKPYQEPLPGYRKVFPCYRRLGRAQYADHC